MNSTFGFVGDTVRPASYHICVPASPLDGVAALVHDVPPFVVFQMPLMPLDVMSEIIAYSTCVLLGATAISTRPRLVLGVPLPKPLGSPFESNVHALTAGQPLVGM